MMWHWSGAFGKAVIATAAAIALGACNAHPGEPYPKTTPPGDGLTRVPSLADDSTDNCRTPAGGAWARQCGTQMLPLESVSEYKFDRISAYGFGEEAPVILNAVATYNRVAAAVQNATPANFRATLVKGADDTRRQLVAACVVEARRFRGRDDEITTTLFSLYAWIRFRQSLIDGTPAALNWDDISSLPCFQRTRDFFLGERPGFLSAGSAATYRFTHSFTHALAAHFNARERHVLADALWFRAELNQAGDRKFACLAGPLAERYAGMQSAKPDLWKSCTANAAAGRSCLKTLKPCGGWTLPPPWEARKVTNNKAGTHSARRESYAR